MRHVAKYISIAATGFMLAGIGPAEAAIVDSGSYLTDTVTHLDWLDITATAGMSYNDVIASPPDGGWHYASLSDVATLFDDAGGIGPYCFCGVNGSAVFEGPATSLLRSLMGDTSPLGIPGAAGLVSDVDPSIGGPGPYPHFLAWYLDFPPTTNYLLAPFLTAGEDDSSSQIGSFLVRDTITTQATPEPATLALFGAGLAGLAARRRKAGKKS